MYKQKLCQPKFLGVVDFMKRFAFAIDTAKFNAGAQSALAFFCGLGQ
jgi:hypothetical protein